MFKHLNIEYREHEKGGDDFATFCPGLRFRFGEQEIIYNFDLASIFAVKLDDF